MGAHHKRKTTAGKPSKVIKEILDYKRKLQAFIIHFELVNNQEMILKLQKADFLLDKHLKQLL